MNNRYLIQTHSCAIHINRMRCLLAWLRCGTLISGVLLVQGCVTTILRAQHANDLPTFRQVDEGFYRGGQPSWAGLEQAQRMGIKTIISLRQPSKAMEEERRLAEQMGMRWVNIPMWFWWRPSDKQVHQFLSIVSDPSQRPVFVHCRQGWNRVGIMTAIYRIIYQGWEPHRAYAEARQLGLVPWNFLSRYVILYETRREYTKGASYRGAWHRRQALLR